MRRAPGRAEAERVVRDTVPAAKVPKVLSSLRAAVGLKDGRLGPPPLRRGTTRFGGPPDVPADFQWPAGPDGPLAFIGPVNLAEVAPYDVERQLPPAGMLYFFYNIRDYAWGDEPTDRQKFHVHYVSNPGKLRRAPFPAGAPQEHVLPESRRVKPYTHWQVGGQDALELERLGVPVVRPDEADPEVRDPPDTTGLRDAFKAVDARFTAPLIPVGTHQLLGWPTSYSAPWYRLRCAAAMLGRRAPAEKVRAEAARWRCLLSVGDDRELYRDVWADGHRVVYLVRQDDLARARFDCCWCALV